MNTTLHPEGIKEASAVEITAEIKDFVMNLSKDVEAERTNRSPWESKIQELIDLRYGYRQAKMFPWKDAANNSIPLIDFHISHAKPDYINLLFGTSPVCHYEPFGAEDVEPAKKRELLFDWRMRTKVKFFKHYCIGVDKALEQGAIVFKTTWNWTTKTYTDSLDLEDFDDKVLGVLYDPRTTDEMLIQIIVEELGVDTDLEENLEEVKKAVAKFREGKTEFEFTFIEVENNQPEVIACSLKEELIVPKDTTDIQWARFIDQPFWRTTNQIKIDMSKDVQKYKDYPDETLRAWGSKTDNKDRSVTSKSQDDIILLHESCCWYDINDDGIKERCIATWPDSSPSEVLRFIELPYDHGQFPYVQVKRELNDKGFYTSRGISALDEDFQRAISTAINQSEDNGTISRPFVVMKRNTVTNLKNRRYIPGETVETTGPTTDYETRQMQNISQPILFQAAQYLKNWSDGRLGNMSSGLSEINNLPGSGQGGKKTRAEIDLISSLGAKTPSLDLQIWQQQMADVFYQIDALYDQYGDDEEEVLITNEPPQKITRREIQGRFNIVPNGRLDNTDPALKVSKAFNLMKIFIGDPDIKQEELKKYFLMEYDDKIGKKLMYTPQEKQQREKYQQQMLEQMKQKAIKEGLDLKEIDIMLEVMKESLLAPITGKKFAPE